MLRDGACHRWRLLVAAVILALLPVPLSSAAVGVGDVFPDLGQLGLEGSLPDWKGKVALIDLWASWCAPCRQSFPAMNELQKTYGPRGLVVIAVSVDEERSSMERFLVKLPAVFPVLRDGKQALAATADVQSMPTSYLIDASGKVRFIHKGYHGDRTRQQYVREIEDLLRTTEGKR